MRRASLLRSTPFRLATIFSALFISAFIVSSFIAVQTVRGHLIQKLDRDIGNTYSVVAASFGEGDAEDLLNSVQTHVAISDPGEQIFMLTDAVGTLLAGNIKSQALPVAWSTTTSAQLGLKGDQRYRVFAGEVSGYRLAVGKTYAETDEVGEIVATTFMWAVLLVLIGAAGGGAILAFRLQRRMDAIAGTMAKISEGYLKSRIPLRRNGDDIDILSMQINATLDRLSGLFEGMKQVSADIAHDLKTPLNRLKLTIQGAIAKQEAGEGVREELAEADQESDRINATFDALLRIAQIESGARKARFSVLDLGEVFAAIVEAYEDVASDDGKILIHERGGSGQLPIFGDRELLLQLFANLVENAIRHCPAGTKIELVLIDKGDTIAASVSDNGPGVPENEQENVLRRLYRLDESRTTPGSGLGLSLVKAIADLHAASLTLGDNGPGLKTVLMFPKFKG